MDLDGRVCHWSTGAEAVFGFSAQEMVGLNMAECNAFSGGSEDADRRLSAVLARVLAGETVRCEVQRRRKDGTVLDLEVTFVPWRADGRVVGMTSTTVDITARKRAERAREQALASLQEALQLARLGSWTWDPQAGSATWSGQTYELFGRDPAFGPAVGEELLTYIHLDDRERIREFGANPPPGGFEFDVRLLPGHDDQEHVLHAIGYPDPARPRRPGSSRPSRAHRLRLDLHLPDINGEVVLARLKADPITQGIPVIVLTADASKSLAQRLAQIGSCEFLPKPLDVPRLLEVITACIDRAGHGGAPCSDYPSSGTPS